MNWFFIISSYLIVFFAGYLCCAILSICKKQDAEMKVTLNASEFIKDLKNCECYIEPIIDYDAELEVKLFLNSLEGITWK